MKSNRPGGEASTDLPSVTPSDDTNESPSISPDRVLPVAELLAMVGITSLGVLGVVSYGLASVGAHDLAPVIALSTALCAVFAMLTLRFERVPLLAIRLDLKTLLLAGITFLMAAALFLPGFRYAAGDKDPGVYVIHGMAIAREGSLTIPDPTQEAETGTVGVIGPGVRFPALWLDPDDPTEARPQFYHLYPALLATAHDLAGPVGIFHLNPVISALTVAMTALAVRRAFGWTPAILAAVFLSTNMLQVWQAKYPSTEMITQALVMGALFALVLAVDLNWAPPAGVAGFLTSATWITRPDGVLVVLLAAGMVAAVVALHRHDRRCTWFVVGALLPIPLATRQAYDLAATYTSGKGVPAPVLTTLMLLLAVGAAVGYLLWPRIEARAAQIPPAAGERNRHILAGLMSLFIVVVGILAWNRESLLGIDMMMRLDDHIRSYDEANLQRLALYFSPLGIAGMAFGMTVVCFQRWQFTRWLVLGPGLITLPIYLWAARITPFMMWWGRRYVPLAMTTMVIALAVGLGWLINRRRGRTWPVSVATGAAISLFLVWTFLSQSLPLRDHDEFGGSYHLVARINDLAGGEDAVFLWQPKGPSIFDIGRTFGGPLWFIHNQTSMLLPADQGVDGVIDQWWVARGESQSIFVITRGDDGPPEGFDPSRLQLVYEEKIPLPAWEESYTRRPDRTVADNGNPLWFDFQVWRVTGPSTQVAEPLTP